MIGRDMGCWIIEGAGIHFEQIRQRRIEEHERCAAIATKRPLPPGECQSLRLTVQPFHSAAFEKCPRHRRSAARLAAVFTMAVAGLQGGAIHLIAKRTAQTAALDRTLIHKARRGCPPIAQQRVVDVR